MKIFSISLLAFLFLAVAMQAQVHNVYIGSGSAGLSLSSTGEATPAGFNDLYINSDWKLGTIITKENALIQNLGLRFNVTAGQFEMVSLVNPERVKRVNLDGKVFVYTRYVKPDGEEGEGYFQLLSEGKTHFMLQRSVERKAGKKGLYGYDAFQTIVSRYFIQKGEQAAVEVKKSKMGILDYLSDKKESLESFIREKNLSLYRIKDIGILLKYYDSLSL